MFKLPAILVFFVLCSFTFRDEPLCPVSRLSGKAPFHIGTALNTEKLKHEERYWTTALAHYNSFTPEKVMKPMFIHARNEGFDFWEVDHLIEFCRKQKIRLHGHTLVWDKATPKWMEHFKGDTAAWKELLRNHVFTIVDHCKNYVRSWDVVNEAFNDDGSLRQNIWYRHIGPSYMELAFTTAAKADPGALLFYNDYSLENNGEKLTAVLRFFKSLRANGVKVDGLGLQMHVSLHRPAITDINQAALRIQEEGFLVHYSELDISLAVGNNVFVGKKKLYEAQRQRMKEIVQGYMKLNPASRFGITLWGVSDNDSWLMEEAIRSRPLLFNTRYKPKPAYCGFLEGLGG